MKKQLLITLLSLLYVQANSQYLFKPYNQVPNPSFEYITDTLCQQGAYDAIGLINKAYPWFNLDINFAGWMLWASCRQNGYIRVCLDSLPCRTGQAIAGFNALEQNSGQVKTYTTCNAGFPIVKLKNKLVKDKKYLVEMWLIGDRCYRIATNNIGILLSDTIPLKYNINCGKINTKQVLKAYGNPILTNRTSWQRVSNIYTAKGTEQYLIIGNFDSGANTDTAFVQPCPGGYTLGYIRSLFGGYSLDDVSVIPLDNYNWPADAGRDTTITKGDSAFIGTLINGLDTVK